MTYTNKLNIMINRNVIAYNDRERLIFIEIIAIKKNVILYKIDKNLLRNETLKNDLW